MERKDTLARLLSMENITVIHAGTTTATFNTETRVLTLPVWESNEYVPEVVTYLTGHEVGHALFTPQDERILPLIIEYGPKFKSFLNVVEDVRIERLIQNKYPGLRRDFTIASRDMFEHEFFGTNDIDLINSKYSLIDRINVYFSLGGLPSGVTFTDEEMTFVDRAASTETFDDVIQLTIDLYLRAKFPPKQETPEDSSPQKEENEEENGEEESEGNVEESNGSGESDESEDESDESADGSGESDESEESDDESDESADGSVESDESEDESEDGSRGSDESEDESADGSGESDESVDESEDEDSDADFGPNGGSNAEIDYDQEEIPDEEIEVITDDLVQKNIEDNVVSGTGRVYSIALNTDPLPIIPFTDVISIVYGGPIKSNIRAERRISTAHEKAVADLEKGSDPVFKKFLSENKSAISYMVKEFEMKKSAEEFRRTTVSKTGVIDPVAMNNYLFSDDIFKRINVVPEGKKHGFIVYVDFSGSMSSIMENVMRQVFLLVMFLRRIGVRYKVYAFSNGSNLNSFYDPETYVQYDQFYPDESAHLIELFCDSMSNSQFRKMTNILTFEFMSATRRVSTSYYGHPLLGLHGTPLNDALMSAIPLYFKFKKGWNVDILNSVFLTDGQSNFNGIRTSVHNGSFGGNHYVTPTTNKKNGTFVEIIDPISKKRVVVNNTMGRPETNHIIKLYREITGEVIVNFFLADKYTGLHTYFPFGDKTAAAAKRQFNKTGFHVHEDTFYDAEFLIKVSGMTSKTESIDAGGDKKMTPAQLKKAFNSSNSSRKNSRPILTKFVEMVS